MNAFCIIKSCDGVLEDMDQNPGVYANVTHSTSQEGVLKRENLNMFVNSEFTLLLFLTDEDYENSEFLNELDQKAEDGTPHYHYFTIFHRNANLD